MGEKLGREEFKDLCGAYREGETQRFKTLQRTMETGFKQINDQIGDLRKEIIKPT